jgi:hypothetical protein
MKPLQIYRSLDQGVDGRIGAYLPEYRIRLLEKIGDEWKCQCWLPILVPERIEKHKNDWKGEKTWLEETGRMLIEEPVERSYSEDHILKNFVLLEN